MIERDRLVGWLVMFHNNTEHEGPVWIPHCVRDLMLTLEWVEDDGATWDGTPCLKITTVGRAIFDLHAPEWGINPIPQEAE